MVSIQNCSLLKFIRIILIDSDTPTYGKIHSPTKYVNTIYSNEQIFIIRLRFEFLPKGAMKIAVN
jgi:hypothetical protein